MSDLALTTNARLAELVERARKAIDKGAEATWEFGEVLSEIKALGLYLTWPTFEAFCHAQFDITPRHANRVIKAWHVHQLLLGPRGPTTPSLQTERQARELARLEDQPDKMAQAWTAAVAKNESPTAADVRREVKALLPEKPKQPERNVRQEVHDRIHALPLGPMLPDDLEIDVDKIKPAVATAIKERAYLRELMTEIRTIRNKLEALRGNPITAFLPMQSIDLALKQAWRDIRAAEPYAPCIICNQKGCRACRPTGREKGIGWISRQRYRTGPKTLDDLKKLDPK